MNKIQKKFKKAKFTTKSLTVFILFLVLVTIMLNVAAELIPEAQTAGNEMNASNICNDGGCYYNHTTPDCVIRAGNASACELAKAVAIPLGSIFDGAGIVFLIIVAMLLFGIVKSGMKGTK